MNYNNMSSIYNGKIANDLTKNELLEAILKECGVIDKETPDRKIVQALDFAFTEGWRRGEDFGREYYK